MDGCTEWNNTTRLSPHCSQEYVLPIFSVGHCDYWIGLVMKMVPFSVLWIEIYTNSG